MLWAMLFYYLFSQSSAQSSVIDIADALEAILKDDARVSQLQEINTAMLKLDQDDQAAVAKTKETLFTVNANRSATESEFTGPLDALDAERDAARKAMLDYRFQIRGQLSEAEWTQVYAEAMKGVE